MAQLYPISLRVTHRGIQFDSLAETCFIAQRCSRDYARVPHLVIEIWPPHPDRPTDVLDIWKHLRKLRRELRDVPLLQRVSFFFGDNEMAAWTHNGKALNLLHPREENSPIVDWGYIDVTFISELFCRVSATKASFDIPRGLTPSKTTDNVRNLLRNANVMMMGRVPIEEDIYTGEDEEQAELQDYINKLFKSRLQLAGAKIARDKLDAMISPGRRLLTPGQWEDFMAVWSPHFERLGPDEIKGKRHYVYMEDSLDRLISSMRLLL
ncbi:MAG: hypothetical protein Q9175_005167 [Cornicularia normoerica]